MSEHILPQKTVALVLNTTVTLTWGAPEFAQSFPESIIKKAVAMRLSCSTTATQAVYVGVRYRTITKDYRVAERKSISLIPASGTVEITPASVAALGLLNSEIIDITVEFTAASTGSVTATLILDDEPPPLSNDPGDRFGLDAVLSDDYIIRASNIGGVAVPGISGPFTLFTVPASKRFYIDYLHFNTAPTPSYPGLLDIEIQIVVNGLGVITHLFSSDYEWKSMTIQAFELGLRATDSVIYMITNNSTSNVEVRGSFMGRELF